MISSQTLDGAKGNWCSVARGGQQITMIDRKACWRTAERSGIRTVEPEHLDR